MRTSPQEPEGMNRDEALNTLANSNLRDLEAGPQNRKAYSALAAQGIKTHEEILDAIARKKANDYLHSLKVS